MKRSYLLAELAQLLGAELRGNAEHEISALATLQSAGSADLSFIANPAYKKYLSTTQAGALLINAELADEFAGNKLVIKNPYVAYARLSAIFEFLRAPYSGIHPTAVIGEDCFLGEDISIGANAVIGDGVTLADGVIVGPGSYVGNDSVVGANTRLAANVSVYHGVSIGADCMLHSGCVIGADGFGFAPDASGWIKIHQLGGVQIGNKVEIGACTCIDRGALDDTFIGDGAIIDNQVQIGHNVRIGKNTAIAAHTAIAGSTTIGAGCTIAGAVAIAGHLTLADKVHITGRSMVSASISEPGSYSSGTPLAPTKDWRKNAARFRHLDALATRLIKLERTHGAE
ncbi:UDP-3-O-(3-hydroxymyristoyl)glucosamine N-acyltransferase [Cellvibrio fibrivorans]|uniref:UDP-3-O-acylglucosamine N-acyltransferase n=1 Tax=Cellvibrio fibrivorans TaxID=126350 RepID=A0ABU1UXD9_9GAMM|nr:UDP-3-O-(3-hydroxymyristoyl)glucosamine N-acyltransferase [Cellvibrio fibrivorans]MDR7089865.1 UDP-3-O-[3-hydroxymyristoyl] glucosamine N-acyltransferase [Cellvibrio fibrivorans]